MERPWMFDGFGWLGICKPSQQAMQPQGECESTWKFWKRMADALDMPEVVPWDTLYDFYDWRLQALNMDFETFAQTYDVHADKLEFRKYERTGFATPGGKVELKSPVLEDLGFDPLPYYRPEAPTDPDYPLKLFTGVREHEYFQTGGRHIPELRKRTPEPCLFVSGNTAKRLGLRQDEWVSVETTNGSIEFTVGIRENMPDDLVRIPHGWWKPETDQGLEQGLSQALRLSDAILCRDDDDYLDAEQGIPHLKGVPCRIVALPKS